jgi:isobutyryl-CoA mutase
MGNTTKPTRPDLAVLPQLKHRTRFVTAASLFDGHDAAINIMRRILQSSGAEVIHLGHNRSVSDIVTAAMHEDAQAIAISSYQGGHVEFFKYIVDRLKELGIGHVKVFGGGGGTITPAEVDELHRYGVTRLYSPEDGRKLGLQGIINDMLESAASDPLERVDWKAISSFGDAPKVIAQALTCIELGEESFGQSTAAKHLPDFKKLKDKIGSFKGKSKATVIGITGTGGAGKSSLTDEILLRLLEKEPKAKVAVLAIDPTRRKTGGALLGDRMRMNSLSSDRCFMRSFATREANTAVSRATNEGVELLKAAGFDWIIVETGGIGQADTAIVELADINVYVMTSEFGAPTQLEKINMLDYAHIVVINKFDKKGALDALTDVRKQYRRNHLEFEKLPMTRYPIFGTIASRFNNDGVNRMFEHLVSLKDEKDKFKPLAKEFEPGDPLRFAIVPMDRVQYLSDISTTVRAYKKEVADVATQVSRQESLEIALREDTSKETQKELKALHEKLGKDIPSVWTSQLTEFEKLSESYRKEKAEYQVRNKIVTVPQVHESLSHQQIRRVVPPEFHSRAERVKFIGLENLPGYFPYTAGVFPFKRLDEDPKRQFAGEGTPTRTNKRFHLLCDGEKAKRLSTAFDSVTLYGQDPHERPDIYGKIGESGVSVCTLDDAKKLYAGFDLCDPNTSVSMTINGPAPMLLAFFFNTAIDQQVDRFFKEHKRQPSPEERIVIGHDTLKKVRGTVQADILKEDQAQNTCIFSTEFALRMMGDIQAYFIEKEIRNYYSVSISGYHIAEAGANPISQLAFTLANGFTFVEYYRSRGMKIDDFAPNFSFFFSNGLDAEYTVIGRVARRIWAIAMKRYYKANDRSQKLKYHIQTSGRSLHAQEISFNDIRTTLQALIAHFDNCNSLHTNAYDEAVTTPTAESVRRAMAIQLVIAREFGWAKNENPLQGSYFIQELTELVEEAVLKEFDSLTARGGVLGAMETQYQRSKIQEESMHYEKLKHSGELPIVGVNTYLNPDEKMHHFNADNLTRASYEEKQEQIKNLRDFQKRHADKAPQALKDLKDAAHAGKNIFEALMVAARVCSLGQMSQALYEAGGQYRRGM